MKNEKFALQFLIILSLGLVACGKKVVSDQVENGSNANGTSASGVGPTTSGGSATSIVDPTDPDSGPTCFNPMDIVSLTNMRTFFYPNSASGGLQNVPNANGDLNFCLEYRDSSDIMAQIRVEYMYQIPSNLGTLFLTWLDMKIFNNPTDQNWRFFHGENVAGKLELIWFDGLRFISLTADQVAGDVFNNGEIRYSILPIFEPGDARGAFDHQEIACRNGTTTALNCVANDVYSWEFYRQYVEGHPMVRIRPTPVDGDNYYYDHTTALSGAQSANILAMVRLLLDPASGSATLAASLASMDVKVGTLGTNIDLNLATARAETIEEHP